MSGKRACKRSAIASIEEACGEKACLLDQWGLSSNLNHGQDTRANRTTTGGGGGDYYT